jgi:hypothetical protein
MIRLTTFGNLQCDVISQLLTAHGSAKRGQKAEDEAATLQQIRAVNPEAGVRFLEHLVLQKRRTVGLPLATVDFIHRHPVTDIPYSRIRPFTLHLQSHISRKSFPYSLMTRHLNSGEPKVWSITISPSLRMDPDHSSSYSPTP